MGLWESPRMQGDWGCFGGGTTKTPPHLPLTTAIPREPKKLLLIFLKKMDIYFLTKFRLIRYLLIPKHPCKDFAIYSKNHEYML